MQAFRPDEAVDIGHTSDGYFVGWNKAGEYLHYTVAPSKDSKRQPQTADILWGRFGREVLGFVFLPLMYMGGRFFFLLTRLNQSRNDEQQVRDVCHLGNPLG